MIPSRNATVPSWFPLFLDQLQARWQAFYQVSGAPAVSQFLLAHSPTGRGGSGVWVHTGAHADELELGIYFDPGDLDWASLAQVAAGDPLRVDVLSTFWVVAEEISHFGHLVEHARRGLAVRALELEVWGERDKLLLAGDQLERTSGDPHLRALYFHLFERRYFFAAPRYERAHHLAGRLLRATVADRHLPKPQSPESVWRLLDGAA